MATVAFTLEKSLTSVKYAIIGSLLEHMAIYKIRYMASIQRVFEYRFEGAIRKKEMKCCWFIAQIDQDNEYYINFSDVGKGYI